MSNPACHSKIVTQIDWQLSTQDTRFPGMTSALTKDDRPDPLLLAFASTDYRVALPEGAETVRIGNRHQRLDRLAGRAWWAIVTAFNPGARLVDTAENRLRHQQLIGLCREQRISTLPCINIDPTGQWPDEPSLLMSDVAVDTAISLARHFGQRAVVCGRAGQAAELWLVDGRWQPPVPAHCRIALR